MQMMSPSSARPKFWYNSTMLVFALIASTVLSCKMLFDAKVERVVHFDRTIDNAFEGLVRLPQVTHEISPAEMFKPEEQRDDVASVCTAYVFEFAWDINHTPLESAGPDWTRPLKNPPPKNSTTFS